MFDIKQIIFGLNTFPGIEEGVCGDSAGFLTFGIRDPRCIDKIIDRLGASWDRRSGLSILGTARYLSLGMLRFSFHHPILASCSYPHISSSYLGIPKHRPVKRLML